MNVDYISENMKPADWPANEHELSIDRIYDCVKEFEKHPTYITRDVLVSLTNQHDLNQSVGCGIVRVTDYEVGIINSLYMMGSVYQINSLKTYLYDIITQVTRIHKIASWLAPSEESYCIPAYEKGLYEPLRLYHFAYQKFTVEKKKPFAQQLIEIVNDILSLSRDEEAVDSITHAYSLLLSDISHMHGRKREMLWEFTREELFELLNLEAKLLKLNHQSANTRPTKGVLMIQISNFVLKSRHGYNQDYICKYLPIEAASNSIINRQIWMKKTALLNDEREQRVVPELFNDETWIHYDWAKNIDFTSTRTYYVSSFSKTCDSVEMQSNYGECLYGYKNDTIAELIAPIYIIELTKRHGADKNLPQTIERPMVAQVIAFDVLYDAEEAKEELQYLFDIINMFDLSNDEKKQFLQEILQYWILSVKDVKWEQERERRYILFLYDGYNYKEVEQDETFLKVKTSLFLTPDFILGKNPSRQEIARQLAVKRKVLYSREYMLCENCLYQEHDISIGEQPEQCPICGSKKVYMVRSAHAEADIHRTGSSQKER